jgi:phosphoglycerate dehydrogenase-like enzyme
MSWKNWPRKCPTANTAITSIVSWRRQSVDMIVLLGGTGYIGRQFARRLTEQGWPFVAPSRSEMDYTRFGVLRISCAKPSRNS